MWWRKEERQVNPNPCEDCTSCTCLFEEAGEVGRRAVPTVVLLLLSSLVSLVLSVVLSVVVSVVLLVLLVVVDVAEPEASKSPYILPTKACCNCCCSLPVPPPPPLVVAPPLPRGTKPCCNVFAPRFGVGTVGDVSSP